jgi:diguanylate cyclase (GGDEF)-like protein
MSGALRGAALALAGVGIVEALLALGLQPYAPIGWPGLGVIAAAALLGWRGIAGAVPVAAAYYAVSLAYPERFPVFFADWHGSIAWLLGIALLSAMSYVLGEKLRKAQDLERELRAAHRRVELALEGSSAALWDADLITGKVYLSDAWAALLGDARRETYTTVKELMGTVHPDDVEAAGKALVDTMKGLRPDYAMEHRVRDGAGQWRWILSRGRVTERDPQSGRALRMVGTNLDITERKLIEHDLQRSAQYDWLTGAASRPLLEDRLRHAMARSRRAGTRCALLYLDVDGFKQVNDRYGHAAGDALLKGFAARLRSCVRESDTIARLGGDEFVVLLENLKEDRDAAMLAEKILRAVREPMLVEGRELTVTTSIGVARADGDWDAEGLLRQADAALYRAKQAGRNAVREAHAA